jgi:hypothetical protein
MDLAKQIVSEARCRWWDWRHSVHTCGEVTSRLEDVNPTARASLPQKVMETVLTRIRESTIRGSHDCFVVYVNPELAFMIDEMGVFVRYFQDQYCRIWRTKTRADN